MSGLDLIKTIKKKAEEEKKEDEEEKGHFTQSVFKEIPIKLPVKVFK